MSNDTTGKKAKRQFNDVSSARGAPMGRRTYMGQAGPRSISLFKVRLDHGGYDDGGAYWGINSRGTYLYCARTDDGEYRQFVRAASREDARQCLGITPQQLKRATKEN